MASPNRPVGSAASSHNTRSRSSDGKKVPQDNDVRHYICDETDGNIRNGTAHKPNGDSAIQRTNRSPSEGAASCGDQSTKHRDVRHESNDAGFDVGAKKIVMGRSLVLRARRGSAQSYPRDRILLRKGKDLRPV
jgi:hypothetical protein